DWSDRSRREPPCSVHGPGRPVGRVRRRSRTLGRSCPTAPLRVRATRRVRLRRGRAQVRRSGDGDEAGQPGRDPGSGAATGRRQTRRGSDVGRVVV
ncbi:MAG: hypothetical protein AVDCRST_MAG73-1087, partial [uncultured Thermomicrobiales bacterium]